jgi:hypothetical protein
MKVGDRVQFKGRTGTVTGFMPAGMTDVKFDDVDRVERRHESLLQVQARKNRAKASGPGLVDLLAVKSGVPEAPRLPASNASTAQGVPTWAIVASGVAAVAVIASLAWALTRR